MVAESRMNPDLDEFFRETDPARAPKKRKIKRKRIVLKRDQARRYAFKVLSVLAGLDLPARKKVLTAATRLNEA